MKFATRGKACGITIGSGDGCAARNRPPECGTNVESIESPSDEARTQLERQVLMDDGSGNGADLKALIMPSFTEFMTADPQVDGDGILEWVGMP